VSPQISAFLGSLSNAVVLEAGGDEPETLLSYGVIDQLQPGTGTEPGADPMAVGAWLLDLLDRRQSGGRVTRIRLGGLSPVDLADLATALGLGTLSQRGASRLAAHTEGNALYCRALLDEIDIAGLGVAGDRGRPRPAGPPGRGVAGS
jgi:hypothetical protein